MINHITGATVTSERYQVRYYDAKLSRHGRGSQVATFDSREQAEAFAEGRRYHARPATVEVVR